MIPDPKIFYKSSLHDYHKFKALSYKHILDNLASFKASVFNPDLSAEQNDAYRISIMIELRQTYFHAIETFFEIFFALHPDKDDRFSDQNLLFTWRLAVWHVSESNINEIASGKLDLAYLDQELIIGEHNCTFAQYVFYFGTFSFPVDFKTKMKESIEAIKHGIRLIATEFTSRNEYNSYKHGLRTIPALTSLMVADASNMEVKIKWDLENSVSFYLKSSVPNELKTVTKLLDSERDFAMTMFCSNLITAMLLHRRWVYYREEMKNPKEKVGYMLFSKDQIDKANKMNVEVQDIVYTIKKVSE